MHIVQTMHQQEQKRQNMHQQEQKLQKMHQHAFSYQFRKKLIQLAISFSLLSIIFLHPSWQPFFQSFISQAYTFSSHLFVLATDKNYIFLLCNGILVFVAKYSSHSVDTCQPHHPETYPDNKIISKAYKESMQPYLIEKSVIVEKENVSDNEDEYENESQATAVMTEDDAEDKYVVYQITDGTVIEKEVASEEEGNYVNDDEEFIKKDLHGWPYEEHMEEENEDNKGVEEVVEKDEAEEEEEAIAKMSTEELNRRFDDFIRRMKEELRIEAQRQLIMV